MLRQSIDFAGLACSTGLSHADAEAQLTALLRSRQLRAVAQRPHLQQLRVRTGRAPCQAVVTAVHTSHDQFVVPRLGRELDQQLKLVDPAAQSIIIPGGHFTGFALAHRHFVPVILRTLERVAALRPSSNA